MRYSIGRFDVIDFLFGGKEKVILRTPICELSLRLSNARINKLNASDWN